MDILEQALQVVSEQNKRYAYDEIIDYALHIMEFQQRLILAQKLALDGSPHEELGAFYEQLPGILESVKAMGQLRKD